MTADDSLRAYRANAHRLNTIRRVLAIIFCTLVLLGVTLLLGTWK